MHYGKRQQLGLQGGASDGGQAAIGNDAPLTTGAAGALNNLVS
jgi:hypothetical protein